MPELIEYQLRHSADRIEVLAVARQGVDRAALSARIAGQLGDIVRGLGAEPPEIAVELPTALERRRRRIGRCGAAACYRRMARGMRTGNADDR